MTREFRRSTLDFRVFAVLMAALPDLSGQTIPQEILGELSSEKFNRREDAQEQLRQWSLKQPARAMSALHRQSLEAEDPEVRVRCLAALKEVVLEKEYRGEGYLGISMLEVMAQVPGEEIPRRAIRIGMVMPGTAAGNAGMLPNDLIIGLDKRVWREDGMSAEFAEIIRETRPGTEVNLVLLDGEKVFSRKVVLGKKPQEEGEEGAAAARLAEDRFFQRWLDKQPADGR